MAIEIIEIIVIVCVVCLRVLESALVYVPKALHSCFAALS